MSTQLEKKQFEANIDELMNIIINSFYSNRDVFLRELISNSSDANDKQRYYDLKNGVLNKEYNIRINPLAIEKCLLIEDDGVGMNHEELINNLSTIASSGTKQFVKSLADRTISSDQIGQFGVGFYSAFLVADKVDVITRKKGESVLKWSSDANKFYTIEVLPDEEFLEHGTKIILYLKEDALSYLEESNLRKIVNQYSSFILYPVHLFVEKEIEVEDDEVEDTKVEDTKAKDTNVEDTNVEDTTKCPNGNEGEEGFKGDDDSEEPVVEELDENYISDDENTEENENQKEKSKPKKKQKINEWEKINGDQPIWYNKPSENTDESYETLYKTISKDWEKPLYWRHFQTEGAYEFRGILFIPSKLPFDLLGDRNRDKRNIKLYVKKVLVLNELDKEMLPDWMNFVVGIIDSADLPLNVSREMLQQNKIVKAMKNQLKKQVMNMMNDLFANDEKYNKFYESFHRHVKLGIHEGDETLLSFLKIKNNRNNELISFDQYVEEYCKEGENKSIYYVTGTNVAENTIARLYTSKGYCVLYFDEPIDEFMLQRTNKYKEFDLVNICKDHTTPWQSSETTKEEEEELKKFCEWSKTKLNDTNIEDVKISTKLIDANDDPLFVLSSKWGWTGNMEKIMASQPLGDTKSMMFMKGKRIVELNLNHPVILQIKENYESNEDLAITNLRILYNCGLLAAGFPLENTTDFLSTIYGALKRTPVVDHVAT